MRGDVDFGNHNDYCHDLYYMYYESCRRTEAEEYDDAHDDEDVARGNSGFQNDNEKKCAGYEVVAVVVGRCGGGSVVGCARCVVKAHCCEMVCIDVKFVVDVGVSVVLAHRLRIVLVLHSAFVVLLLLLTRVGNIVVVGVADVHDDGYTSVVDQHAGVKVKMIGCCYCGELAHSGLYDCVALGGGDYRGERSSAGD